MATRKKPTLGNDAGRVLRKAAQVLADREWTQHNYGSMETRLCAVQAIRDSHRYEMRAGQYAGRLRRAEEFFTRWLVENGQLDLANPSIPVWNDAKGRTKDEVLLG